MNWADDGYVLRARKHGENALIVTLLTAEHGRHAGLVRGGTGRRARGIYQTGNRVRAAWRARLDEHLGSYACELVDAHAAALLHAPPRLAALSAAAAVMEMALPEREPHAALFEGFAGWIDSLVADGDWLTGYVRWELALLGELGFGLDLSACAATGLNDELAFVSPKSGRAVSRSAGARWRTKLLVLPDFLGAGGEGAPGAVLDGLRLTGHFLERHVFAQSGKPGPAARTRFVDRVRQMDTISGS